MYTDHKEREQRTQRRQQNMCPTHDTKLITTYYEDLDLLVTKCRDKGCLDGHGMTEQFKAKKERKKQAWLDRSAQVDIDQDERPVGVGDITGYLHN